MMLIKVSDLKGAGMCYRTDSTPAGYQGDFL